MVNRAIIEDYIIHRSPMFERINKKFRRPEVYVRILRFLREILPEDVIKPIVRKEDDGIYLFYFHRELRLLFSDLAQRIIRLGRDDDEGWLEFCDRFLKAAVGALEPVVEREPDSYQILEIGMRKLLAREIEVGLKGVTIPPETLYEKTGKVVNGIFHKIRTALAKKVILRTVLLQETFLKFPFIIGENDYEILKTFQAQFRDFRIPFPIFYALFNWDTQHRSKVLLDLADEYLTKGSYYSLEELFESFPYYLYGLSDDEIERIVQEVKDSVKGRIRGLEQEREALQSKINLLKEKMDSYLQSALEECRHNLLTQPDYDRLKQTTQKIELRMADYCHHFRELKERLKTLDQRIQGVETLGGINRNIVRNRLLSPRIRFPLILNLALAKSGWDFDEEVLEEVKKTISIIQKEGSEEDNLYAREFKKGGLFKERVDTEVLSERYRRVKREIVAPLAACLLLEEIVEILPKSERPTSLDEIVFVSELTKEEKVEPRIPDRLVDRYRRVISLLIYDIRGSTFMGTKLENARVENEVRNLFNQAMLDVARRFHGYPVKDTGDGGIILFGRNILECIEERGKLEEDERAAINAIQCAVAMVDEAEEFVKRNLKHYRDWFKEARIRELEFEGGAFAQLPPEYQSIFQIGVGVVSGSAPREVYFDRNAFGEFDVTGMLVREANLFSKARSPDRSMIICDEATLFSLILNSESISFLSPEGSKLNIMMFDMEQAIEHWLKLKERRIGFVHEARGIAFRKLDVRLSDADQLRLDDVGIGVDDFGLLVDDRGGRVKFAYEVVKL
ncbi:hypothetical protein DRP53_00280 [candidate division WOR-3 bacterium]|uniref:Guanylate cyclase domain-containing protein n=1 Tax=candidate division WOR-3 bacterium TaxID=2052148 RepID=A0A660SLS4_UNCW3|nr:MAG: hypothetical protein DRP53_00280 [candidate division WOR-3 bacterium]